MKYEDHLNIIPVQYAGNEIDAIASVTLPSRQEAIVFFDQARKRLLDVNKWHTLAGTASGHFQVTDGQGNPVQRNVQLRDHLRIDIPGPGSASGDGYDWVLVEVLTEITLEETDIQSIGFRVRPATNPCNTSDNIAHFYDSGATSSFIVSRKSETVCAYIIDKNIQPNKAGKSLTDKIRNTSIAMSAIGMFSKWQWQKLANGIVSPPVSKELA